MIHLRHFYRHTPCSQFYQRAQYKWLLHWPRLHLSHWSGELNYSLASWELFRESRSRLAQPLGLQPSRELIPLSLFGLPNQT